MQINKLISKFNFNPGTEDRVKYIVIHYCGSLGDAKTQAEYFSKANRNASAHYFVGYSGEIWQSVEEANIAWHCGAKKYQHPACRNANSIGIEMCCKTTGSTKNADEHWYFEDATVKATIELTKTLMDKYHIRPEHVIRHYDVTGKCCPAPYVFNTGKHTWSDFKKAIGEQNMSYDDVIKKSNTINRNEAIIWNFLKEKGLNDYAVAGIMGNLYAESGLRSNNLQNGFEKKLGLNDEAYTKAVDDGTYAKDLFIKDMAGYGLAQWTFWSRKKSLYEFIKEKNKSIGDLEAQLEYFWKEISSNGPLFAELKYSNSVKEASDAILHLYERPADQSAAVEKKRADFGTIFYDTYAEKGEPKMEKKEEKTVSFKAMSTQEFEVRVDTDLLNIRKGPSKETDKMGYTGKGVFTIVETKDNWGKLKSGGWICLDYAKRV